MQKKAIKYVAPKIDGWELDLAQLLCESQIESIVTDDSEGIDF